MILVTRLNGDPLVLNAELVVWVEPTPDTLITLTTGSKLAVREPVQTVHQRVLRYRQEAYGRLRSGRAPGPPGPGADRDFTPGPVGVPPTTAPSVPSLGDQLQTAAERSA